MTCTSTSASSTHASTSPISLPRHRAKRSAAWNTLNVLIAAQRACQVFGLAPTTFGRLAAGDPRLIGDMRNGRTLRPEVEAKVRDFITGLNEGRPGAAAPKRRPKTRPVEHAPIDTIGTEYRHRLEMAHGSAMLLAAINAAKEA